MTCPLTEWLRGPRAVAATVARLEGIVAAQARLITRLAASRATAINERDELAGILRGRLEAEVRSDG